jgi:hypothetical protein
MAKQLARLCYRPKRDENDIKFAAQVFIEQLVIPKDEDSYTEKQMEDWVLEFLNSR